MIDPESIFIELDPVEDAELDKEEMLNEIRKVAEKHSYKLRAVSNREGMSEYLNSVDKIIKE